MSVPDRSEPIRSLSRPTIPAGLLGMLAIMIVVEVGLCCFDSRWTSLGTSNWRQTGVASRTEALGVDVLFFGDSLVKTGLIPVIFEERLGFTGFNLAVLGGPPSASYYLFLRALEAGARPRAVVLDAQPPILMTHEPSFNLREWAELIGPGEMLELARVEQNPSIFASLLLNRYLPSIRYRQDIRKAIADLFNARSDEPDLSWVKLHDRQMTRNRGSYIRSSTPNRWGGDPRPNGDLSVEEARVCYPEMWWARRANLVYLEKFVSMAESKGIPVFFLLPPIHPRVQAKRESLGLEEPYLSLIRKIHRRFPSVVVIDGRHAGFDHGLFWDAFHLGRDGAMALSSGVADVIGSRLIGKVHSSRWATLPTFTEPRPQLSIEDVEQSRERLGGFETIRR